MVTTRPRPRGRSEARPSRRPTPHGLFGNLEALTTKSPRRGLFARVVVADWLAEVPRLASAGAGNAAPRHDDRTGPRGPPQSLCTLVASSAELERAPEHRPVVP